MTESAAATRAVLDRHLAPLLEPGVDPATFGREARLREDLGFTSLEAATLLMELEREFDLEVTDEEVGRIQVLGDLLDLLGAKLAARRA